MTGVHRFYTVPHELELTHDFWVHDKSLLQSFKDAKLTAGSQLVLFDGAENERLYEIKELSAAEAHLILVTDFEGMAAARKVYVLYGLPVRSNHDDLLIQCTRLGANHFLPIITDKTNDMSFDHAALTALLQETAEKYGRGDIP